MGTLSELLATPLLPETTAAQKKNYVTYHLSLLPGVPSITLLESRNLISASGTTGLRTWEAGLHLGQYLCRNPETVRGRRVLELGAGTGYLSVLCAAHLGAEHVVASDGSDDVIHNLPESFFLNGLQGSPRVTPMEVRWGHALVGTEDEAWNAGRPVDVVIGADVTYDSRVIPALVATIVDVLALHPRAEVYISAAHRSDETFGTFVGACHQQALDVEDLSTVIPLRALQGGPFYDDQVPMHVCKVSKSAGP
jgi:predicted nicotinamide N-methyase